MSATVRSCFFPHHSVFEEGSVSFLCWVAKQRRIIPAQLVSSHGTSPHDSLHTRPLQSVSQVPAQPTCLPVLSLYNSPLNSAHRARLSRCCTDCRHTWHLHNFIKQCKCHVFSCNVKHSLLSFSKTECSPNFSINLYTRREREREREREWRQMQRKSRKK